MKILLTGCGSEGSRGIIHQLRAGFADKIEIFGVDTDKYIANQTILDKFFVPPSRLDKNFISFIIELVNKFKINIIWPISTFELEVFAVQKQFIEQETDAKIMIGTIESILTANNKVNLYRNIVNYLPNYVPDFYEVDNKIDLKNAVFAAGYPEKAVCIKKTMGAGGVGLRILDASANRGELLLNAYGNLNRTCHWDDVENALKDIDEIPHYIVCEYLPGDEWDCDILCFNGKCHTIVTRKNLRMSGGMSILTNIIRNFELEDICEIITKNINFSFIYGISFKLNAINQAKLLEINARPPGTIICCFYAGFNVACEAVKLLLGAEFPHKYPLKPTVDINIMVNRFYETVIIQ
jgi:carbamoyl-phosphate synthase large subunit